MCIRVCRYTYVHVHMHTQCWVVVSTVKRVTALEGGMKNDGLCYLVRKSEKTILMRSIEMSIKVKSMSYVDSESIPGRGNTG